jgi:hypothetical protein
MPWIEITAVETLQILAVYRIEADTPNEAEEDVKEGKPTRHSFETLSRTVEKIVSVEEVPEM